MLYKKIMEIYNEAQNFSHTLSLLNWDQSTYMPINGVESHAEIIETLAKTSHKVITSDRFFDLLCEITEEKEIKKLTRFRQKEIQKIKSDVERKRKISSKLIAEIAKTTSIAMSEWEQARKNNDDKKFLPLLKKIFDLKREIAASLGYEKNPYDALIYKYDKGLKYEFIKPLFDSLETELIKILQKINNSNKEIKDDFLFKKYDISKQWNFGLKILKKMGIDFNSFRQDLSAHPFTTNIGAGDVRITTDIIENNFKKGFYSTIHEGGHSLYEISTSNKWGKSPFANLDSLSLHESQSRFYENIIARSFAFWEYFYPDLNNTFPDVLNNVTAQDFYFAVNKVENNPIRIESDEVTYNLHIILRTQIENSLINNEISVSSINEIWNENTKKIFGFYPKLKSQGYLQDIHWSDGLIGYFPTYTMGNIISAQFYYSIQKDIGELKKIDNEKLKQIYNWFDKKVYSVGSQYTSMELVKKVTGEELNWEYFVKYLRSKFFDIYN